VKTKYLKLFFGVSLFLSVANFISFFVVSEKIGGDAYTGKVEKNTYYLHQKSSKTKYVSVKKNIFYYSLIHCYSLPLVGSIPAFFYWLYQRRKDRDEGMKLGKIYSRLKKIK